jgi:hypothetical protein
MTEPTETQDQLVAYLKRVNGGWEWARTWGAIVQHRTACLEQLLEVAAKMLDDPAMTRSQMRRELAAVGKRIIEHGP